MVNEAETNINQPPTKHENMVHDIGMHKGEDTDYYLKKGFRVIGFEADPLLAEYCRDRFSDAIKAGNLVIIEGAILDQEKEGEKRTKVQFYVNKEKSVWGTVSDAWATRNEGLGALSDAIEVPVVDYREYLDQYGIPHYVKIDIEGMDMACLRALLPYNIKPDYVSIESEKVSFERLVGEFDLLEELGYSKFKAVNQSMVSRMKEPNPSYELNYIAYKFQQGSSGLFGRDLPGQWKSRSQITKEYQGIFNRYRLYGDYGLLTKYSAGLLIKKILALVLRKSIPGWYDTHAEHSSVRD